MSHTESDIREVIRRYGKAEQHPDDLDHAMEELTPFGDDSHDECRERWRT